jgi:hypothetical protein
MAEKPQTSSDMLGGLIADLRATDNASDLFKLATSADFLAEVNVLNDADKASLRVFYTERQSILDNKVKLETFDGQTVLLVGVEAWVSDYGDGVTLHIQPMNSTKVFKALSSSAAIVRFVRRLNPLPSEEEPYRIALAKVPVSNPEDAARGYKRWTIKMLPMAETRVSGAPF